MSQLEIKIYPSPFLRKKSTPVSHVTDKERKLLDNMAETMYKNNGIGLAAPQVGVNKELIVVNVGDGLIKLINPKVIQGRKKDVLEEGCLSLPNICIKVARPKKAIVMGLDENGKPVKIEADGLLSKALQHEIDHLKGTLIIDYAPFWKKIPLKKRLHQLSSTAGVCKRI